MRSDDKAFWAVFGIWGFFVLLNIALLAGGIYIVMHFVLKYW